MLQQTQVSTVIGYYERFMQQFPNVFALAKAEQDLVFAHWAGLGYYQRARNLHKTSQVVVDTYQGIFPLEPNQLIALPGIGKSTAHAICSIVGNLPVAILDANAKRVIMRYHNVTEDPNNTHVKKTLWHLAESMVPPTDCRQYTQGIMDLGAQVCIKKPLCALCPVNQGCKAFKQGDPTQIPLKRKRLKKPKRACFLIWYRYQNTFFMQKRPETGVWSNLWCPIESTSKPEIVANMDITELPQVKHVFTHFILHITPLIVSVTKPFNNPLGKWFPIEHLDQLAVPAAVKKIHGAHITRRIA